jgi:hypothetical protein
MEKPGNPAIIEDTEMRGALQKCRACFPKNIVSVSRP